MKPIERLARVSAAIDELAEEQYKHCMGPQDAIGAYPRLKREYDDALEDVIRQHASEINLAPCVEWHPVAYYQRKWARAAIPAYSPWSEGAREKSQRISEECLKEAT